MAAQYEAIGHQEDLPRITTGHATTTAAVVLAMKAVLDQSGRAFAGTSWIYRVRIHWNELSLPNVRKFTASSRNSPL